MILKSQENKQKLSQSVLRWAVFSLFVSVLLMGVKWAAYAVTSSSAVLSDALESGVNVLTSSFVLFAVWLASRPRDQDHPYGHGKVEFFSSGFEGALILFAALSIAVVAIARTFDPVTLENLELGMAIQVVVSVLTFASGQLLIHQGKKLSSPSLVADGIHIRADAITTVGTLIGVFAVWITGALWLDTAVALVVAIWLGWSGVKVVRVAVGGLMDEADPEVLQRIARTLQENRREGWLAPHHTKVMQLGQSIHIDLHMVFPAYWTIERVHDDSKQMEKVFQQEFGERTEVMLHMESCTSQSCSYCCMEDCPIRQHEFVKKLTWDSALITAPHRAKPIQEDD